MHNEAGNYVHFMAFTIYAPVNGGKSDWLIFAHILKSDIANV